MACVTLADFRLVDSIVKPHIERIALESNWLTLYTEIKADCLSGNAYLFTDTVGFIVLKPIMRCCIPMLLIWAAYHPGGNAIPKYHATIDSLGIDIGAHDLEFWTSRKGFKRVAPAYGWRECASHIRNNKLLTIWRKSLCDSRAIV